MPDKSISQADYDALKQELAETRQALAQSRENEALIRKLMRAIEQSPTSIVITNPDGAIEYANPKFAELTGYSLPEAVGQNPRILKTEYTDPKVYDDLWATITQGGEWRGRFVNRKKNGDLFWEAATISGLRDENGNIISYIAVKEDITALALAERQLQESETRYRLLAENASDVIWSVTLAGEFTYISPSIYNLCGYTPDEIIGRGLEHVLSPEARQVIEDVLAQLRRVGPAAGETARVPRHYEFTQKCKDGAEVPVEASISTLYDEQGGVTGILGVSRDITARKQLEAEREQLISDLDSFAHMVAHDIKNPLSLINGYAYILDTMRHDLNAEQLSIAIDSIQGASERAVTIVETLLLFASVRNQKDIPQHIVDMQAVVQDALKNLGKQIGESGCRVIVADRWPLSLGYEPWIREIWANYISNAVKYGGSPPEITLGATEQGDVVRFWVRDNGAGISVKDQARLFTSFERLDQVRIEGHGVGLSIVKRIAEKLGGSVGVDSTVGEGSTFWFTLPKATE